MRRDGPDPADMPMPPDVFARHAQRRNQAARPDPLHPVPRREPAESTSELARELLAEAAERPLESGEILLVSEETRLDELEAAAGELAPAGEEIAVPDDPVVAVLAMPRLLSPRVWEVMDWQPPLAEHLRLLEAALLERRQLPQTMLVGHVETMVERVEHLMRLRHLAQAAADAGGAFTVAVRQASPEDLPATSPMLTRVLAEAKPAQEDTDRRHAVAVARLALGAGMVQV